MTRNALAKLSPSHVSTRNPLGGRLASPASFPHLERWLPSLLCCGCLAVAPHLRADQVEMQNGDRYVGQVLSLNADTLFLKSEVLGTVRLPRARIASISLGPGATAKLPLARAVTNRVAKAAVPDATNAPSELDARLRQIAGHTNLLQQVQAQLLGGAGPEANDKFSQMIAGLASGKITAMDLRREAQSAADQLRAARKDLGDEGGFMVDSYLSVLDGFLKETSLLGATTNAPASAPATNGSPAREEE